MKSRCNKCCKPGSALKVSRKKAVVFKEAFSAGTPISYFVKNKITVFHLEGKVFNCLQTIVMNFLGFQSAARTDMFFGLCFNEDFHKCVSMNNFLNDYIFQIQEFVDTMIMHLFTSLCCVWRLALGGFSFTIKQKCWNDEY